MLEVQGLRKSFDGFTAIDDVSLKVSRGEIAALIGPNGAGKSTLFNLITGHLRPDSGEVRLKGEDITSAPPHRICLMGIGRSFQRTNIFPKLTVFENVQAAFITHRRRGTNFWARSSDLYRDDIESICSARSAFGTRRMRSAGRCHMAIRSRWSSALRWPATQRSCCWTSRPPACPRPKRRKRCGFCEHIARERSLTLLFTEHDMEVVFSVAQRIAVMHQGRMIAEGTPAQVQSHAEVRRVYLGERH